MTRTPERRSGSPLVLIAEDEQPIADIVASVVSEAGYTPLVASHGRHALELMRERHPDLLISDLMMPFLSGEQLIAEIRRDAQQTGATPPPIILMTAASLTAAKAANADAILRKPFDLLDLEDLLQRFLARHTSRTGAAS